MQNDLAESPHSLKLYLFLYVLSQSDLRHFCRGLCNKCTSKEQLG